MRAALITLSLLAAYTLGTLSNAGASDRDDAHMAAALDKVVGELGRIRTAAERCVK